MISTCRWVCKMCNELKHVGNATFVNISSLIWVPHTYSAYMEKLQDLRSDWNESFSAFLCFGIVLIAAESPWKRIKCTTLLASANWYKFIRSFKWQNNWAVNRRRRKTTMIKEIEENVRFYHYGLSSLLETAQRRSLSCNKRCQSEEAHRDWNQNINTRKFAWYEKKKIYNQPT